jgi:hypothetical protein
MDFHFASHRFVFYGYQSLFSDYQPTLLGLGKIFRVFGALLANIAWFGENIASLHGTIVNLFNIR